jgi:putative ABC transport system permease protein
MNPGETVRTALSEIRHHKMRSGLTLLGIVLGTMSITVMTSFLDGVKRSVWEGFGDLGFDGVMYVMPREARDLREQQTFTRSRGLQPSDADVLISRRDMLEEVAPALFREELLKRGAIEQRAQVMGVTPAYPAVRDRNLTAGRFFNDVEESTYARVCVIGYRAARRYFGNEDPLGKTLQIAGRPFHVVGVGEKLGNQFVNDSDFIEEMEGVYIPLGTMRKYYAGDATPLSFVAVKAGNLDRLGDAKAELVSSLKVAHKGAQDFRVENIAEEMLRERANVEEILGSWTVVLSSIAGISLVVGGIGLLSVMLISIGERLYEVGLRKSMGASDLQIFIQFLSEAVTLSVIGGLLGAAVGVGLIWAVAGFFPAGLPVNFGGLLLSLAISVVLGALYGIYPALKASRLPPVEALRSAA